MEPANLSKTAVTTPFGLFESLRVPFELGNAAQTFQRFINRVLHGLDFCVVYIDILVANSSLDEHLKHIEIIFQRFIDYGIIILNGFLMNGNQIFGHKISATGIHYSIRLN